MKALARIRGSWSGILLAVACLGVCSSRAVAQNAGSSGAVANSAHAPLSATLLNEQGLALYSARDFRHALEKFVGAYALEPDTNLLFNIGRCYEQLGESDAALEKYQQFISEPGAPATGVARARASIDAILEQQRSTSPGPSNGGREPTAAAPDQAPKAASGAPSADWRPWLTLGGSIAFAAAGATAYALGVHDHAQLTNLPEYGTSESPVPITWRRADSLVHSGNTKKVAGGVMLGLSGALAAITIALFLSEDRESQPAFALPLEPTTLHGGGGLLLAGTFR